MKKYLKRGNTWSVNIAVTQEDDDGDEQQFDCTGYNIKMWIKEQLKEIAPEIAEIDISWTDQSSGEGFFKLDNDLTSTLLGKYYYEIILYESVSNDTVQTLVQDILIVRDTLEVNL